MPSPVHFAGIVAESFGLGRRYYGEIDPSLDLFSEYIWGIVCKNLNLSLDEPAVISFTKGLYLRDLYLTCGCVHNSEKAWAIFNDRYRKFITGLVRATYRHGTDNEEVADSVLVSLYLNDRSGRQRIASYNGRSSLATWLRVIVLNRAINDGNERRLTGEEAIAEVPDCSALTNVELSIRAQRYTSILSEALTQALRETTEKERLILLWRYEQNLQLGEIARLMGIHQANVTRQIVRLQIRIRKAVIQHLATRHHLSDPAIKECLSDVVHNPQMSIPLLALIKQVPKPPGCVIVTAA